MAVHARYLAHASPHDHDPRAATRPALEDTATGAPVFQADHQLAADTFNDNNNDDIGPRKRARLGDVGLIRDLGGQPVPQAFAAAGDVQSRVLCSGAASTSGRSTMSQGLLSHVCSNGVEIDAIVRNETERLRAGIQEARRRHARAVVSAVERAAAKRLRAAEADLERAVARSSELEDRLRQTVAEAQAWQGVAAGLRATLDGLTTQSPPCTKTEEGDAEDARSCCGFGKRRACRSCGAADACVLLLPCRHLCLCGGCDGEVCPVCAATKNASSHE